MVTLPVETHLCSLHEAINQMLEKLIPASYSTHKYIYEAARYALLGPGKRIRPTLLIASAELFDVELSACLIPACSFEMIHAYSLIHDDLPCMDNDHFRRGRPTVHRLYSEAIALLAGDFLLTKAFECLNNAPSIDDQQKTALTLILSQASGGEGMIGGQLLDITSQKPNLEKLQSIHSKKTGALIQAAILSGAIIGKASPSEKELLSRFGLDLGIAFQIIDDILDVTFSIEKHGRAEGSDAINEKTTYVSLLGIEKAKQVAFEHIESCLSILNQFSSSFSLQAITHQIVSRIS